MYNKIVFYIRALFEESKMPKALTRGKNFIKATNKFTELSNISLEDYRIKLRLLQKKILENISARIIINKKTTNTFSYMICQPETYEQFLCLNDDDIIIPLDDDDWILPDITKINFEKNGLTCWNSFILTWSGIKFMEKNQPLPHILNEQQLAQSKLLTASGYAISANTVKQIIKQQTNIELLNTLLQRHSRARECIRLLNFNETFVDNYLSVYVKHAANMTLIQELDDNEENAKKYFAKHVLGYKNHTLLQGSLPEEVRCYTKYIKQLEDINNLL